MYDDCMEENCLSERKFVILVRFWVGVECKSGEGKASENSATQCYFC